MDKNVLSMFTGILIFLYSFYKTKKRYHPDDDTNDDYNTNTNNTNNIILHIFFQQIKIILALI